jgi:hypothetical protein
MIYIVMPDGLAVSLTHRQFDGSLLFWGRPLLEDDAAPLRRGMFIHDFTPVELDQPPMSTNPNVEVLNEWPADWRPEIDMP